MTMDYSTLRISQLQHLASGGDVAAANEIARRAQTDTPVVSDDVTTMDAPALRALIRGWRDGRMPEDRDRSFELARRAHAELSARYEADTAMFRKYGAGHTPIPPGTPPWEVPRPPRVQAWQRPTASKLYPDPRWRPPSPEARESWRRAFRAAHAAGAPQRASE